MQWQRERWAALPDIPYKGITFTMPDVLWPLFRDNPHLRTALSSLAASIIQTRASIRSGLRVGVIAVLHTFNGKLEFNSHVHTLVTAGGLYGLSDSWVEKVYYDRDKLFESWRRAVIKLLRTALRAGQLVSTLTSDQLETLLAEQEARWWSVKIQSFKSKDHFLRYAGRYVRRPPIAQKRVSYVDGDTVRFWYRDKKVRRRIEVEVSPEEFIDRWGQHIPESYKHAVKNFGLFAPRATRHAEDLRCCLRHPGTGAEVASQAPTLGRINQARLQARPTAGLKRQKNDLGTANPTERLLLGRSKREPIVCLGCAAGACAKLPAL